MKKLFFLLSCFFLAGAGVAFAKSDLQFHLGYMMLNAKTDYSDPMYETVLKLAGEDDDDYYGITARVENFNLFDVSDVVSLGFFENAMYGKLNGCYTVEFMLGPAVGLKFCDFVKFHISAGFDIGIRHAEKDLGTPYIPGVGLVPIGTKSDTAPMYGFAADLQAKFLPEKRISPVAGVRYAWAYAKILDNDAYTNAVEFYLGASFNF